MHINDFITTAPISCQCPHQTMVNETAWLARDVILFWTCHCHLTVHTSSVYNSLHKACELNSSPQNNSPIFHYKNHQEVAKDNLYNYLRDYVGGSRMFVSCKWVVIVTHVLPSAQNNGISWPFQRSHGNKKKIVGPVGNVGQQSCIDHIWRLLNLIFTRTVLWQKVIWADPFQTYKHGGNAK